MRFYHFLVPILVCTIAPGLFLSAQDFQDRAEELGIDHITICPHGMAGGVSIFDFNNDGWQDIYFTGGVMPDHLYKNNGDGTFTDVSEITGIGLISDAYTMGVVAGDLDNDGFTDLFITTFKGERDIFLRNVEGESFTNKTPEINLIDTSWTSSATLGDYDRDGDLDIYVSNYVDFLGEPFFTNIIDGNLNQLLENKGNWQFLSNQDIYTSDPNGCTLATAFTDINKDMEPDLFVINDFGVSYASNKLYINTGDSLVEVSELTGTNAEMNGMGIAIGDFNEDGYFDYYLTNIRDNILFSNGNQSIMNDVSEDFNVNDGSPHYSWGTFFADLNNDTNLDLYVGKGSIRESNNTEENKLYEFYPVTNNFADVTNLKGLNDPRKTRGVSYGDLNNDGKLDIVLNNIKHSESNPDEPAIYMNEGLGGDYLSLALTGVMSNNSGIGARVDLHTDDKMMMRELTSGGSYLSNHSYVLHFGLGGSVMDSMLVYWPSGLVQKFQNLEKNKAYTLIEGEELDYEGKVDSTSSVELITKQNEILLQPNPANDYFTVHSAELDLQEAAFTIYDRVGSKATLTSIKKGENVILDVSRLRPGLYFLKIDVEKEVLVKKFEVYH